MGFRSKLQAKESFQTNTDFDDCLTFLAGERATTDKMTDENGPLQSVHASFRA